ncbi:MAG: hypothetical protein WAL20_14645, partial [Rhodomicrobium sp.]
DCDLAIVQKNVERQKIRRISGELQLRFGQAFGVPLSIVVLTPRERMEFKAVFKAAKCLF